MGREEVEIGLSLFCDPIFASSPIIHQTTQHHWLVLCQISLLKLTVIHLFPIHLLYLPSNFDTHFFIFCSGYRILTSQYYKHMKERIEISIMAETASFYWNHPTWGQKIVTWKKGSVGNRFRRCKIFVYLVPSGKLFPRGKLTKNDVLCKNDFFFFFCPFRRRKRSSFAVVS